MSFREKLNSNEFVVTMEVEPPKGNEVSSLIEKLILLGDKVDAYNVTDMQSSMMRLSSWAMAILLKQQDLEPILQLTCRDRNILALQGDLLGVSLFGIDNLLLLSGDSPRVGDHPQAKPVFELDSIGLIKVANKLNDGYDAMDNKLKGRTNFFIGAALNPFAKDESKEMSKLEKKIEAGASFFQTQPIFDIDKFHYFIRKIEHFNIKILAGVMFLKSYRLADYLNSKVEGIEIPSTLMNKLKKANNFKEEMLKITRQIINSLREISNGIHIMPLGWYNSLKEVL